MGLTPAISVIIPTLNEEARIASLLEKLAEIPDLEIIISDGGSTDQTVFLVNRYPVILVNSERGRGHQLNVGAGMASAGILWFIHADTDFETSVIEDIKTAVASGHFWGCCTLKFDQDNLFYKIIGFFSNVRSKHFSSCYGDQGIYCRRDIFLQHGRFSSLPIMEDLEFSRRLSKLKKAHVVTGKMITSVRRFEENGPLRTICKMQILKTLYKLGVSPEVLNRWYRGRPRSL